MAGGLENLVHPLRVVLGRAQQGHVPGGNHPFFAPGFADGEFYGQPFFVLVVIGPDPLHGGPGISVNHSPVPVCLCAASG